MTREKVMEDIGNINRHVSRNPCKKVKTFLEKRPFWVNGNVLTGAIVQLYKLFLST